MSLRVRWLVFSAMVLLAALTLMPLRLAGVERFGVTAKAAHGTIWSGRLENAQTRTMALGDIDLGLSPIALTTGRLAIDFAGGNFNGTLVRRPGGYGVSNLNGQIGPMTLGSVPLSSINFDRIEIRFAGGVCAAASGQLRLQPAPILGTTEPLTGVPRCNGAAVMLPLASASGQKRLDVTIYSDGRYQAVLALDQVEESLRPALLAAGFKATTSGLASTMKGSLK